MTDLTLADVVKDDGTSVEIAHRLAGQDIGNPSASFPLSDRVGHKTDPDSYLRSRKLTYKRKIIAQKRMKGKS